MQSRYMNVFPSQTDLTFLHGFVNKIMDKVLQIASGVSFKMWGWIPFIFQRFNTFSCTYVYVYHFGICLLKLIINQHGWGGGILGEGGDPTFFMMTTMRDSILFMTWFCWIHTFLYSNNKGVHHFMQAEMWGDLLFMMTMIQIPSPPMQVKYEWSLSVYNMIM